MALTLCSRNYQGFFCHSNINYNFNSIKYNANSLRTLYSKVGANDTKYFFTIPIKIFFTILNKKFYIGIIKACLKVFHLI